MELIRREARIDEEEEELVYGSPIDEHNPYQNLTHPIPSSDDHEHWEQERVGSSSPEPSDPPRTSTTRDGIRIPVIGKPYVHEMDYSGNDHGSFSDFSDTAPSRLYGLSSSQSRQKMRVASNTNTSAPPSNSTMPNRPDIKRNASEVSGFHADQDHDRVIMHGYLLCLKSKGAVRQWKKLWVVLRPKNLAFYKNEEVRHDSYSHCLYTPLSFLGILRPPTNPPLLHPLRGRNRPGLPQQKPLHADHCGRKKLSLLRAERRGASAVVGSAEKPTGKAEGERQPADGGGCLSGAELCNTGITGRGDFMPSVIPFIMSI